MTNDEIERATNEHFHGQESRRPGEAIPCPRCGAIGPDPCGHAAVVANMGDADGRQLLARLRELLAARPGLEWYVSEDGDMQSLVDGVHAEVGADDYSVENEELAMLAVNAASRFLRFDTTRDAAISELVAIIKPLVGRHEAGWDYAADQAVIRWGEIRDSIEKP